MIRWLTHSKLRAVSLAGILGIFAAVTSIATEEGVTPRTSSKEVAWSKYLAQKMQGEPEYTVADGRRVDILTDEVAWEVEWGYKWEQSIGQAIGYSLATEKDPGVILLLRPRNVDDEQYNQFLTVVTYLRGKGVPFKVKIVKTKD